MAPPRNAARRNLVSDAAIEILGTTGSRGLSHRAVDKRAGLPPGTAANYFSTRDDLLAAAADRVAILQFAEMADATAPGTVPAEGEPQAPGAGAPGPGQLAELLGNALYDAATVHRVRYLAIFELLIESTRRPALADSLAKLSASAVNVTTAGHQALGVMTSPDQAQVLITLYGGALLTLTVAPPGTVTYDIAQSLARAMVGGVLSPR
jgi:AcrR family transcriptional regulator